jgi:CelD/BcsL family acetyltransferase involved in cellulose biosynthesis
MDLNTLNPVSDTRWDAFVARHSRASVFHTRGWLEALARTYGYEPFVLTSAVLNKPLVDGVAFCRVSSWITGTRLVSLPFADHCEPLLGDSSDLPTFLDKLRAEVCSQHCKYVELRPLTGACDPGGSFQVSRSYFVHQLDLTPTLEQIFRELHKDSIQRRIRRAEKERLAYEQGRSERLVREFYRLQMVTRRRHQLPPQPLIWFQNLIASIGEQAKICLVRKNDTAIAAMLILRHRFSVVYKYGCSDERFHNLGAMPLLFWRVIEESKMSGAESLDLGRCDLDNSGLITFKDRLGARKRLVSYYRYSQSAGSQTTSNWRLALIRHVVPILPDAALSAAGNFLYRHIG